MNKRKLWVSILAGLLALIMVLGLFVGVLPGTVDAAGSVSELKKEVEDLSAKKKEIDKKIAELEGQLTNNLKDMGDIVKQKNLIDQEIFMLHEQTTNLNAQIATFNLLIADKQEELDAAQARLKELNEKNKERIRAMEEDGDLSYWSVLFKANDFSDLLDRLNIVEEIAAADQRRLKEMSEAAEQVEQAKGELETERTALEASKEELKDSQEKLEVKSQEAVKLLKDLIDTGEEYQKLLADAEDEAASADKELQGAKDELKEAERQQWLSTSVPPTPSSKPSGGDSYVSSGATWLLPCKYTRFSSPFGYRVHPVYGDWRFHYGVDLAAPSGTPIVATRAGKVTRTTYDSSSGYYVVVDHQDGFTSKYLHMTHYIVSPGQQVSAGQVLGYVGSTGASTGPHLHFSILYNGTHVNPAKYINI